MPCRLSPGDAVSFIIAAVADSHIIDIIFIFFSCFVSIRHYFRYCHYFIAATPLFDSFRHYAMPLFQIVTPPILFSC
jgi:hypothetical protein